MNKHVLFGLLIIPVKWNYSVRKDYDIIKSINKIVSNQQVAPEPLLDHWALPLFHMLDLPLPKLLHRL